jgi:hypothetical protein
MSSKGRGRRRYIALVVCTALGSAAGCASVLGIDSERHVGAVDSGATPDVATGDEPAAETGPFANVPPNWQCLNQPPPGRDAGAVSVDFQFNSAAGTSTTVGGNSGTPLPGVQIHACNTLDVGCLSPITSNVISDDGGNAALQVPEAFTGYYELQATSFNPSILARGPQYHSELQAQSLAPTSLVQAGGALAGVQMDPNLGFVVVSVFDCTVTATGSKPAGGVTFTIEGNTGPNEQIIYLANNYPTSGATQTDDVSGTALVFNVPVQPPTDGGPQSGATLTLRASFAATGQEIRTVSALVREGWVTYVDVRPDQADFVPIPGH